MKRLLLLLPILVFSTFGICQADSSSTQVIGETPAGTLNGTNCVFTLQNTPMTGTLVVYKNGVRQQPGGDYTLSGVTISFLTAPAAGDLVSADYLTGGTNPFVIGAGGMNLNGQKVSGTGTFTGVLTFNNTLTVNNSLQFPANNALAFKSSNISWGSNEFVVGANTAGGTVANDFLAFGINTRASSVGPDAWQNYMTVSQSPGAVNIYWPLVTTNVVTMNGPVNLKGAISATGGLGTSVRVSTTAPDTMLGNDHTIILNGTTGLNLTATPVPGQEIYLVNVSGALVSVSGNGKSIWTPGGTITTSLTVGANSTAILQWDAASATPIWRQIK